MRTKTLLVAAAVLAAGLVSVQADPVYSQNVVGYINITLGPKAFWFFANQLNNTSVSNNANKIFDPADSDPNAVTNTVLYYWNGHGYDVYKFFTGADWDCYWDGNCGMGNEGYQDGWYAGGVYAANLTINPGGGDYLYNPQTDGSTKITIVGEVVQGTNCLSIVQGYNALSLFQPIAKNIDAAPFNYPGTSDPNAINNDRMFIPKAGGGYYVALYFTGADWDCYWNGNCGMGNEGNPDGWYSGGAYVSLDPNFIPLVGEAFFIQHVVATTVPWCYSFAVQ